jgi:hypothetical protein
MKATATYQLSSAGQKNALKMNLDANRIQEIVIEIENDDLDMFNVNNQGKLGLSVCAEPGFDNPQTQESILRFLRERKLRQENEKIEEEKAIKEERVRLRAEFLFETKFKVYDFIHLDSALNSISLSSNKFGIQIFDDVEILVHAQKLYDIKIEKEKEAEIEKKKNAEQFEKEKEASVEFLKNFAFAHGSEDTKLAIELGQAWQKLAWRDFVNFKNNEVGEGWKRLKDDDWDEKNDVTFPSLNLLQELKRVKELGLENVSGIDVSFFVKKEDEYNRGFRKFKAVLARVELKNLYATQIYKEFEIEYD